MQFILELAEQEIWKRKFVSATREEGNPGSWRLGKNEEKYTYQSMFSWSCEMKRILENVETDMVTSHDLIFDFDNLNLDYAMADARSFALHLEAKYSVPLDTLQYFFSGCKGFHIYLPIRLFTGLDSIEVHLSVIKSLAMALAGNLQSFDASVYKRRQLIRRAMTYNAAGQLWKVGLSLLDFMNMTIEDVRTYAQTPRECEEESGAAEQIPLMAQLFSQLVLNHQVAQEKSTRRPGLPEPSTRTVNYSIDAMFNPAEVGERNNKATALAGLLVKKLGNDFTLLHKILVLWNGHNREPLSQRELLSVTQSVYGRYHGKYNTQKEKDQHATGF